MAHLKKDPATGHLLKSAVSGHLINECAACPCAVIQPDALVSIAGDCADCHEEQIDGAFTWEGFVEYPTYCEWTWERAVACGVETALLVVLYCKATSTWCARIRQTGPGACCISFGRDADDCACGPDQYTDVTAQIKCNVTDLLSGTFDLVGDVFSPCDCSACTATVTLDP